LFLSFLDSPLLDLWRNLTRFTTAERVETPTNEEREEVICRDVGGSGEENRLGDSEVEFEECNEGNYRLRLSGSRRLRCTKDQYPVLVVR
jgi:hypothetical protein